MDKSKKIIVTPYGAYKNRSETQKIAMAGVFFGLVILFQYLERFMPFGDTYLKLNFSLLFILPIFYFSGPKYGLIILILRFAIGPAVGTLGYSIQGVISHIILMISTIVVIVFLYVFSIIFHKEKSYAKKYIYISLLTTISSALILALLNGLLFSPLYWWSYDYIHHVSFNEAKQNFESNKYWSVVRAAHFGINKYWLGILAVYFTGNIVKFGVIFTVNYPLSKVIRHYY